jgi:hypothetical protein
VRWGVYPVWWYVKSQPDTQQDHYCFCSSSSASSIIATKKPLISPCYSFRKTALVGQKLTSPSRILHRGEHVFVFVKVILGRERRIAEQGQPASARTGRHAHTHKAKSVNARSKSGSNAKMHGTRTCTAAPGPPRGRSYRLADCRGGVPARTGLRKAQGQRRCRCR